jgi:SPASM domain peptide maturase of grasp-with-spasm system
MISQQSIEDIKKKFNNENDEQIDEYFNFLEKNEFGNYCLEEEIKLFPKLNLNYEEPAIITNCIIDVNNSSTHNYVKIFENLNQLLCSYWQFRFFDKKTIEEIDSILVLSKKVFVQSIHLIIKYDDLISMEGLIELFNKYAISLIEIYNAPKLIIDNYKEESKNYPFVFIQNNVSNNLHCGNIDNRLFNTNLKKFTESNKFNSCLNQKISIDTDGEIKNCPSMKKSYGSIKNITLQEALEKTGFKDVWNINKDKIKICKNCEYRHICTDCRAYLETPEDIYSKPLKCGYNPYTATWEEWSINPLKQQTIEYYGMEELVVKRKK